MDNNKGFSEDYDDSLSAVSDDDHYEDDLGGDYEDDWDQSSYDDFDKPRAGEKASPVKNKNFNKIIIGGALVLGLGIFYMQMRPQGPVTPPAPAPETAGVPPTQMDIVYGGDSKPSIPTMPGEPAVPASGLMNNPEELGPVSAPNGTETLSPREIVEAPPMPAPIIVDASEDTLPAPVAQTATPSETPEAAPSLPAPAPTPAVTDTSVAPPVSEAPLASDVTATNSTTSPDMSAVATQLEAISSRLSSMESDISSLKEKSAGPSSADLPGIQNSLKKIEKRLDKVEARSATARASSAPESSSSARPAATAAPPRWILKSAMPGQALISQAGQQDMRTIAVGETLPGLGRVTGIYVENGRWVVQGDQGRLTQ